MGQLGAHRTPQQAGCSITLASHAATVWLFSAIWRRRGWTPGAQLLWVKLIA